MYLSLTKFFVYIVIFLGFLSNFNVYALSKNKLYSETSISNYFSGLISSNNNNNELALNYLNNLRYLHNDHDQFNYEIIFALIQTGKISEAFSYLEKVDEKNIDFFEANLLLGINHFLKQNYKKSISYFNLIRQNSKFSNLEQLVAHTLSEHIKILENKSYDFENSFGKITNYNNNFVKVHTTFFNCYLDNKNVKEKFLELTDSQEFNNARYMFFYINFLLSKNYNNKEVLKILEDKIKKTNKNLLLDQTKSWLEKGNINAIKKTFDCKNPNHLIAEFFYLIAGLYSSDGDYKLSNFFLNLSVHLNPDFIFNNILLAENYIAMKDYKNSKKTFMKFNDKNKIYKWYAQKRIVFIKSETESEESAINFLNYIFNKLKNPTTDNYYDTANLYKDFQQYKKSIEYYTEALNNINREKDRELYSKILYRRGMSYERLKMWEKSEKDLIQSLELQPEEPYVLNYLAYSWLERNINIDKSIEMLEIALNKRQEDPYIIDSLGWGFYLVGRYNEAEKLLRKAVELMPDDPIVNDHYADILWKLNKNLQANYFWTHALNNENTENKMKNKIKKKLIFGIQHNS